MSHAKARSRKGKNLRGGRKINTHFRVPATRWVAAIVNLTRENVFRLPLRTTKGTKITKNDLEPAMPEDEYFLGVLGVLCGSTISFAPLREFFP
jgi:hypothetical protein